MNPIPFAQANVVYRGPNKGDLPACNDPSGTVVATCWEPTEADRARIAAGCPVWLLVYGGGMPAGVKVMGEDPFIPPVDGERIAQIGLGAPHCGNCQHFQAAGPGALCGRTRRATEPHYLCENYVGLAPGTTAEQNHALALLRERIAKIHELQSQINDYIRVEFPKLCIVYVSSARYVGYGLAESWISIGSVFLSVTLENGNTWQYPLADVRRVRDMKAVPAWMRRLKLRVHGYQGHQPPTK